MFRQRVPENSQNWVCRISHFSLILLLWALQMFFNIGTFCFCLRQVHMFTLPSIIFSVPSTNQMMSCESGKSMYKYKGQTVHLPVVSRSELLPRQVWAACWNHRPSEVSSPEYKVRAGEIWHLSGALAWMEVGLGRLGNQGPCSFPSHPWGWTPGLRTHTWEVFSCPHPGAAPHRSSS